VYVGFVSSSCLTGAVLSIYSHLTVILTAHSWNGAEGIGVKFQWQ